MYIYIFVCARARVCVFVYVPKSNAFNIETAPHLPKLHCNMLFVAKRGSGKSVKMVNMLRMLKETGSMDRIFCISPTFNSNKILLQLLCIEEEDIYSDPDDESIIHKIIDAVNSDTRLPPLSSHTCAS